MDTNEARKMFGISKRAWNRIEVGAKRKSSTPPIRRKVGRRKPLAMPSIFTAGRESECEGVLLTHTGKVADQWAENGQGVKCMLRKHGKRDPNGFSVLLPAGGSPVPFRTKRAACAFIARLAPIPVKPEDGR